MGRSPKCDELRQSANSTEWEDMFILYCRRAVVVDMRLAGAVSKLCREITVVNRGKDQFVEELDTLVGWFMSEKTSQFVKETQTKDMEKMIELHVVAREFQLRAREKKVFIEKLKGKVWICQILQENSQKRTRERMSDQEAKEIKAEAREIMPQPSTVNCS
ncbi:hypothetical protein Tco_0857233 [Tanacetum coccineum]|uniref:Uncharacterized protein n=1 Tax=Tanacetum coccineum TaxID=301880 RepID=A0ABQ5B5L4_9ASTR